MQPPLSQPLLIKSRRFEDDRGWFAETFSEAAFAALGIHERFVQDNHSFSVHEGTIRGIHYQRPPRAQAKIVRCLRGSIRDYAFDLRRGSPTYGEHVSANLTAEGGEQLYIPVGYGHAFVTLEPNVEVMYKVSDFYAPDHEGGVLWSDPALAVRWPLPPAGAILSDKDQSLPTLAELPSPFDYDGNPLGSLAVI